MRMMTAAIPDAQGQWCGLQHCKGRIGCGAGHGGRLAENTGLDSRQAF